ncbi:Helix-turn-helix domain-containing protein [Streptosporangium subroseum]|uniref:Helix-turn-helix domain-containing protein n=2 Tax=Streptosporangium subroseum TaxID=106412 RepID=A0A239PC95_9ACTN|nr:Helix-turn-helix domain-containing protein [Streptosporangium subroseum]
MSPDEVGLPRGVKHRRTPGLRRDEVAELASISTNYYMRLEQGRERCPSDQVLNALARVFHLDAEATEHLHELAHPRALRCGVDGEDGKVNSQVLQLMDRWDQMPVFVLNRRMDVLAQNSMSVAFLGGFEHTDNIMRMFFLSPTASRFWLDWEQEAHIMVAHLRAVVGAEHEDPSLLELVEELSEGSEDFRQMWVRHDVRARSLDTSRYRHPLVGDLILWHVSFSIDCAPGQRLFVAQPEPGSPSEEALAKLSALRQGVDQAGEPSSARRRHR